MSERGGGREGNELRARERERVKKEGTRGKEESARTMDEQEKAVRGFRWKSRGK